MPSKYQIRVENSAPSQHKTARSVILASNILQRLEAKSAADLGCGRLRNLPILTGRFNEITLVDTELQCQRITGLLRHLEKFGF